MERGESVPCDGVLITSDGLAVDESALTDEPEDVDKAAVIDNDDALLCLQHPLQ